MLLRHPKRVSAGRKLHVFLRVFHLPSGSLTLESQSFPYVCPLLAWWLLWVIGCLAFKNRLYPIGESEGQTRTLAPALPMCVSNVGILSLHLFGSLGICPLVVYRELGSREHVGGMWPQVKLLGEKPQKRAQIAHQRCRLHARDC